LPDLCPTLNLPSCRKIKNITVQATSSDTDHVSVAGVQRSKTGVAGNGK